MSNRTTISLPQILRDRLEMIAETWHRAVARTSFVPFTDDYLRQRFIDLTDRVIRLLLSDRFDVHQAEAIGADLAQLHYVTPEALGRTQEVLTSQLVHGLSAENLLAIQPRLATLIGAVAGGFFRQTRDTLLAEQEAVRQALLLQRRRAEESLRESEARFRTIFEEAAIAIAMVDIDGRIIRGNPALGAMLGYLPEELEGVPFSLFTHLDDLDDEWERFQALIHGGLDRYEVESRFLRKDGQLLWGHLVISSVRDPNGRPQFVIGMGEDITDRKRAEESLRSSEARYRAVVETALDAIITFDANGRIESFNRGAEEIFGYHRADIIGHFWTELVPTAHAEVGLPGNGYQEEIVGRTFEAVGLRKNGREFPMEVSVTAVEAEGEMIFTVILRDITERKALEEQLAHRAFHDSLTDLPNRALFTDRLVQALARASRNRKAVGVLFLDLDNFKVIDDSLGHELGDELLIATGDRLQSSARAGDTVARLGGDEFTILFEDIASPTEAAQLTERIAGQLRRPFRIRGLDIHLTASIGLACCGDQASHPSDLLRNADLAMYRAKTTGKDHCVVFDPSMGARASRQLDLENGLRRAIDRNEFRLHYQPIIQLESGRIVGMETLIRWHHPTDGVILPAEFIPLAEERNLILAIGRWTLEEACRQAQRWNEQKDRSTTFWVSVNMSARQLQQADLVEEIDGILRSTALEPARLMLEITERIVTEDNPLITAVLHDLKALGVQLAIDDFGTGQSSLSTLKLCPVGFVKIDQSFVAGLRRGPHDTVIVAGITNLAHALGMKVIAEGIEDSQQLSRLRMLGSDFGQGYFFTKPLPADAATRLLVPGALGALTHGGRAVAGTVRVLDRLR